ncbi:MAG: ComF family protein [Rhodobacteraceae bacterium]|nr:ComF family protein [Paracoccaceae bacterium]
MAFGLQSLLDAVLPPQCLSCRAAVAVQGGLCPACWRATPFVAGLVCDACGIPLPGAEAAAAGVLCDDCLTIARPWRRGRAALVYEGNGRRLVLALKHGDRLDLVGPMAGWMLRAGETILAPGMLVAPVPLHWLRLALRRYNQAALLAAALARAAGLDHCPDLLVRPRRTASQDGRSRAARFAAMAGAIAPHPRRRHRIAGRDILIVDDVMTSGATFAAAAEAALAAGAASVSVLALARVAHRD